MRNLKRALSLALASVMVMGLMVVGTGASYVDVSSEKNQEAIEVLQAVGVMTGDENGNFNPDTNVTRNEMAVVMSNLLDYTVSSYKGTAPFSDVPSWAEPYVAACYTNGIIAGYDAKTFGGNDSVTTGQAALMLMKALGYFQYQSDFGDDWLVETTRQGSQIGLFDDVDTGATQALTRNDVAQMVLNALEANMVQYTGNGGTTIKGDGYEITTGKATYEDRTSTNNKYGKIDNESRDRNDGKYVIQLGEDLYDGDLEKDADADDFGRPGTTWSYEGDEIGTYADNADDSMVINKTLSAQAILVTDSDYFDYNRKDLADDGDLNLYINGDAEFENGDYADLSSVTLKAGDQVELFENDDKKVETIAIIRYSLASIKEVEDSLSSTYTNKGATYAITLETLSESGIGGTYYDVYDGDSTKELTGFNADTYTEGTVLAVAVNDAETILDSAVAESVSGTISNYNSGSKAKVTIDGADFPLHALVDTSNNTNVAMGSLTLDLNDSEYTVYLDKNGYVVGIDESGAAKIEDVYYVTGIVKDDSRYTNYYAQAVSLYDGTVTDFKLNSSSSENTAAFGASWTSSVSAGSLATTLSGLYTFEKDGSGYNAEVYNTSNDSTYYVFDGTGMVSGTGSANAAKAAGALANDLARDDGNMTIGSDKVYLNDNTNYVKIETPGSEIDVDFVTGGTSVDKATGTLKALAIATKSSNNYVASYVVLVNTVAFANASSDDVVFVHERSNNRTSYTDGDDKNQTAYMTELYFMDGSGNVETVMVKGSAKAVGFYTWEINDDGVYELTAANNDTALSNGNTAGDSWTYDDETGWVGGNPFSGDTFGTGAKLTGIFNNALSANGTSNDGSYTDTITLNDVNFAENVIIADDRGRDDRDASAYSSEITSVSQLKTAIDKDNSDVYGVVYVDNEEVIMVYVTSMTNTTPDDTAEITDVKLDGVSVQTYATAEKAVENAIVKKAGVSVTFTATVDDADDTAAYSVMQDYEAAKTEDGTGATFTVTATAGKYDVVKITATATDGTEKSVFVAIKTENLYKITVDNNSSADVRVTIDDVSKTVAKSSGQEDVIDNAVSGNSYVLTLKVSGNATKTVAASGANIWDNGDGTYEISDITGNVTVTVTD